MSVTAKVREESRYMAVDFANNLFGVWDCQEQRLLKKNSGEDVEMWSLDGALNLAKLMNEKVGWKI